MTGRKSGEAERKVVYGRGGAGNIGSPSLKATDGPKNVARDDLETPTLKTAHYTTGRGGSGNMAKNESPDIAREAQDVRTPLAAELMREGGHHTGRGGTGNAYHPTQAESKEARAHNEKIRSASKGGEDMRKQTGGLNLDQFKGLAEKTKEKVVESKDKILHK